MKLKTTISIILLTLICGVSVFSQHQIENNKNLYIEFIPLQNSKLKIVEREIKGDNEVLILDENSSKALKLFKELLSEEGSIEVDKTGKLLIVTDRKNRIEFIDKFIRILDNSGLTFEELFSHKPDKTGIHPLKIQMQNLIFSTSCGSGREKIKWQIEQAWILLPLLRKLMSSKATIETNGREKSITVTDNWNRVILIREIIDLLDKQILEEETS